MAINTDKYLRQWLRLHARYEKRSYGIFRRAIQKSAQRIPFDNFTETNYRAVIATNLATDDLYNAYTQVYRYIATDHGKRIGKQINRDIKEFTFDSFIQLFDIEFRAWMESNLGQLITSVRSNLIQHLIKIVEDNLNEGIGIQDTARELQRIINRRDFYRWQALRIARTETTTAANYASMTAGRVGGVALDKVWISAEDGRTRRLPRDTFDHRAMHLVRVPINEPFVVPGKKGDELVMYPGEPTISAANRIQCRCSVAQLVRRDSNGRVIRL